MHYYFVIRFSIYNPGGSWRTSRQSQENYKLELFDETRLKTRLSIFKSVVLKSLSMLIVKNDDTVKVLIYTSECLVDMLKDNLDLCLSNGVELIVTGVSETDNFKSILKSYFKNIDHTYWSIRLDDDDALSPSFLDRLSLYNSLSPGFVISFPLGVLALVDSSLQYHWVRWTYSPKTAIGLSMLHEPSFNERTNFFTIYDLGSHTTIDAQTPVVTDASHISYLRLAHQYNDSSLSKVDGWFNYVPDAPDQIVNQFTDQLVKSENFSVDVDNLIPFSKEVIKKASRDAAYRRKIKSNI